MSKFYYGPNFNFSKKLINKKIGYIKVSNTNVLDNFTKNSKCFCFNFTNRNLKEFLILYLIKKFNIFVLGLSEVGFFANVSNYKKISLLLKLKFIFFYRISYYFYRILLALRLTPPVEYFFESSGSRIKHLKKLNNKKNNIYRILFPLYFKKIIRINSTYSSLKIKKFSTKKNLITYIDSGLGHDDVKKLNFDNDIEYLSYYKKLVFFLNKIKKNKKKILVCLHPKAKYPTKILKLLKSNFIIKFGTKDAYIHSSEFVIISMSSLINKIIFFKKKLIIANSIDLGNWINKKIININNEISLSNVDLDKQYFDLDKIFKKSSYSLKYYDNFIKKNLIEDRSKNYYESVRSKLEKL